MPYLLEWGACASWIGSKWKERRGLSIQAIGSCAAVANQAAAIGEKDRGEQRRGWPRDAWEDQKAGKGQVGLRSARVDEGQVLERSWPSGSCWYSFQPQAWLRCSSILIYDRLNSHLNRLKPDSDIRGKVTELLMLWNGGQTKLIVLVPPLLPHPVPPKVHRSLDDVPEILSEQAVRWYHQNQSILKLIFEII